MGLSKQRIVHLGNAFLDTIVYLPTLPTQPSKIRALDVLRTGGGIAATAAYTTALLGAETIYWGRLGNDDTGDQILARLGPSVSIQVRYDAWMVGSARSEQYSCHRMVIAWHSASSAGTLAMRRNGCR